MYMCTEMARQSSRSAPLSNFLCGLRPQVRTMSTAHIVLQGWLTKSPPEKKIQGISIGRYKILQGRWKRRWFVLHKPADSLPDQYLLEYFSDQEASKLKGCIALEHCTNVDSQLTYESRSEFSNLFSIRTRHKGKERTYYLNAGSDTEMQQWVRCLCRICRLVDTDELENEERGSVNFVAPVSISSPPVGTPPPPYQSVVSADSGIMTNGTAAGGSSPEREERYLNIWGREEEDGMRLARADSLSSIPDEPPPPPPKALLLPLAQPPAPVQQPASVTYDSPGEPRPLVTGSIDAPPPQPPPKTPRGSRDETVTSEEEVAAAAKVYEAPPMAVRPLSRQEQLGNVYANDTEILRALGSPDDLSKNPPPLSLPLRTSPARGGVDGYISGASVTSAEDNYDVPPLPVPVTEDRRAGSLSYVTDAGAVTGSSTPPRSVGAYVVAPPSSTRGMSQYVVGTGGSLPRGSTIRGVVPPPPRPPHGGVLQQARYVNDEQQATSAAAAQLYDHPRTTVTSSNPDIVFNPPSPSKPLAPHHRLFECPPAPMAIDTGDQASRSLDDIGHQMSHDSGFGSPGATGDKPPPVRRHLKPKAFGAGAVGAAAFDYGTNSLPRRLVPLPQRSSVSGSSSGDDSDVDSCDSRDQLYQEPRSNPRPVEGKSSSQTDLQYIQLQYLDLDIKEREGGEVRPAPQHIDTTDYKEIDFVKTEALRQTMDEMMEGKRMSTDS